MIRYLQIFFTLRFKAFVVAIIEVIQIFVRLLMGTCYL